MLKKPRTVGRSLGGWYYNMQDWYDAAIVNYMVGYLDSKNINYKIEKSKLFEHYVDIIVECDDATFKILRHIENEFVKAQG